MEPVPVKPIWYSTRLFINDFEKCLESMNPDMYADYSCVNTVSENLN